MGFVTYPAKKAGLFIMEKVRVATIMENLTISDTGWLWLYWTHKWCMAYCKSEKSRLKVSRKFHSFVQCMVRKEINY